MTDKPKLIDLATVIERLEKLPRMLVGEFDEGGGNMCPYADESKIGNWISWDSIQSLIDSLKSE